ncbi:unnamed protein product [Effrenium voratum]|uniref:Uncharacterized protein n=1 Tax=Effrenium voratum TaxID=2562239 RepID=A0AA36HQ96_9DINO|nr:unnamed protein product [Effrenium voratum]CAJ1421417.1 unnamed protein product [Effrenium voratum]
MWTLLMELFSIVFLANPIHWKVNVGVCSLFLYYWDERSILHREFAEMIYWALMYAWFGFIFLELHDLPILHLGELKSIFGSIADLIIALVFSLCGIWAHTSAQNDRLQSSIQELDLSMLVNKQHKETGSARHAVYCIEDLVRSRSTSSGQLQRLFGKLGETLLGRMQRSEEEVMQALESCCLKSKSDRESPPRDLLFVLNCRDVDLPQLFALTSSTRLLELLRKHVCHMDTVTKTRLVDALQRQHDFYVNLLQQELVVELLESTTGDELRMLKDIIDEGGDFYNLHKLVFHDLAPDMYSRALSHIQREGRQLATNYDPGKAPIKIISDVDDTLYGSGGRFPAGCDKRYPAHQVYPGVLALFKEITAHREMKQKEKLKDDDQADAQSDGQVWRSYNFLRMLGYRGHDNPNPVWVRSGRQWQEISVPVTETVGQLQERLSRAMPLNDLHQCEGEVSFHPPQIRVWSNLVFLSARPHAYKDYLESKSYQLFQKLRKSGKMHCMPTLLAGKLKSSSSAFCFGLVLLYPRLLLAVGLLHFCMWWGSWGHLPMLFPYPFLAVFLGIIYLFYDSRNMRKESRPCDVWRSVGEDKIKTFVEYRQLYSECATVFFGDNGQGDLMCAERLTGMNVTNGDYGVGGVVSYAFIHQVQPLEDQLTENKVFSKDSADEVYQDRHIYLFRTYVGAAVHAYKLGLISQEGLWRVSTAAVQDMVRLRIRHLSDTSQKEEAWADVVNEMNKDVTRVNELLPEAMEKIKMVPNPSEKDFDKECLKEEEIAESSETKEAAKESEAERAESGDETKSERSTSEEMIRTKSDEENALEDPPSSSQKKSWIDQKIAAAKAKVYQAVQKDVPTQKECKAARLGCLSDFSFGTTVPHVPPIGRC